MITKRSISAVIAVGTIVGLSACSGRHDTSIDSRDHSPAQVFNFPNHFASVATKCDGRGHRIFISDHGTSQSGGGGLAVIDDPSCK